MTLRTPLAIAARLLRILESELDRRMAEWPVSDCIAFTACDHCDTPTLCGQECITPPHKPATSVATAVAEAMRETAARARCWEPLDYWQGSEQPAGGGGTPATGTEPTRSGGSA